MNKTDVLIEAATLAGLPPDAVLVVDCRFALGDPERGQRDYEDAHVPGAVYASLDHDLSDLSKRGLGRHPLPDAPDFARSLARWGWHAGRRVVAYDAAGGAMAAARLWWMLGVAGIDACVLNGGWQAWRAAGLPVESGPCHPADGSVPALSFDTHQMADYADLQHGRGPGTLIIDARAAARFRGEHEPIDRVAGHVPGARNRPVAENLGSDGRFKPAEVLRRGFEALLEHRAPRDVVHMCGSGVFACQNRLAMEVAGLHGSRVFIPSWSGWSSDPARPVATGDAG